MTGRVGHFADLVRSVQGSVKFGDKSVVEICGIGSVVFVAKTGTSCSMGYTTFGPSELHHQPQPTRRGRLKSGD
jgi:hypothetical protein